MSTILNSLQDLGAAVAAQQPVVPTQKAPAWIMIGSQKHFLADNPRNPAVSHILGIRKDLALCPLAIARLKTALPLTIPLGPREKEYTNESKGGVRPPTPDALNIISDSSLNAAYSQYNLHWVSCPVHASEEYVMEILEQVLTKNAFIKSVAMDREIKAPMTSSVAIVW